MKITIKRITFFLAVALTSVIACFGLVAIESSAYADEKVITEREELNTAILNASEGDVLLVGNIDFGYPDLPVAIVVNKSITLRSGLADGAHALFTNGSIFVNGLSEDISVSIEGIDFVGPNEDAATFVTEYSTELGHVRDNGSYVLPAVRRNIFSALSISGGTRVEVLDCSFSGYVGHTGGAVTVDNSSVETLGKKATLDMERVTVSNNGSLVGGGILLRGKNKNVKSNLSEVKIKNNFAHNGGGIAVDGGKIELDFCDVLSNEASGDGSDGNGGGIFLAEGSEMNSLSTDVSDNASNNGGGIYVHKSMTFLDGCVVARNVAKNAGGGVYVNVNETSPVTLINNSVYNNEAANGAGVAYIPNFGNMGKLNLVLCTYYGNERTDTTYSFDMLDWMQVFSFGCIFVDGGFDGFWGEDDDGNEVFFPYEEELPTADNGYNYKGTTEQADTLGISMGADECGHLSLVGTDLFADIPSVEIPTVSGTVFCAEGEVKIGTNARDGMVITVDFGTYVEEYPIEYGERISLEVPTKAGHTFASWTKDGEAVDVDNLYFGLVTDGYTLVPIFTANEYSVVLNNDGVEEKVTVTYGEQVALPTPTKENYRFLGWYDGENRWTDGEYLTEGDITLYASWEKEFPLSAVLGGVLGGLALVAIAVVVTVVVRKKSKKDVAESTEVQPKEKPDTSQLTDREKQVLDMLLLGKKRVEIADALYVSEETVKKQITSIYAKLGVKSRSELFAKFM